MKKISANYHPHQEGKTSSVIEQDTSLAVKYHHALFLNPYIENSSTSAMKLFPPTGLEYVAASAKEYVDKITLLDLRYEKELSSPDILLGFIAREINIVCASISWDRQIDEICALLNRIPPSIPLIVGGFTATAKVEELFQKCPRIDIIVRDEGEETIREILTQNPPENILGISYKKNGAIVHNKHRPLRAADNFIPPERTMRRNEYRLTLNGVNLTHLTFDTILGSRGCPYNCKFCTFTLNPLGQKRTYSARSVLSVVDEIEKISAKVILFSDDNFGVNPKRAEEICDQIIARKIKKRFIAQTRLEIARHPILLEKMVRAGFKVLLLGIESPHDRILKQLDKGFDSHAIRNYFKTLRNYSLYYHGYFIYGNFTETEEEMLYIAQFAKEIGVHSITFLKLRIEKFSPLKEVVEKTPGYHMTPKGVLYSDTYSYDALKKISRRIKFSFYTPSRYIKILQRCFQIRFFTKKDIFSLLVVIPRLLTSVIAREIERGRLGDSLRRTFLRNTS